MKRTLVSNLSANTLQLVVNQLFGVLIFYILSINLDKNSFGLINLALAILLSAFNILSCGIDQVVIKKIAHGDDARTILSIYAFHVIFTGVIFYGVLLLGQLLFGQNNTLYNLVCLIGLGKLLLFFSTPLKQVTNGMERFKLMSYMLIISNMVRGVCLTVLALLHLVSITNIVYIFICGDALELIVCGILFYRYTDIPISIRWIKTGYIKLLRESLPQVGVVLVTSALARFDWLFIGFMVSAAKLAEYSFAYKIFEISTLPLLAIAPLLIPRFARLFKSGEDREADLKLLIRTELIIAAFTGLLLNMFWNPLIDIITHGKYGAVNTTTMFILSLCMPLLYLNNFLWTIFFVQDRLKMIFHSFLLTLAVNVAADLILIPIYKNQGAAIAFLLACLAQSIFYILQNKSVMFKGIFVHLLICTTCAVLSGWLAKTIFGDVWLAALISIIFYCCLLILTRQVKRGDDKKIFGFLNY